MCELLAMSTSQPARLTFSFRTLASHGRESGNSPDGWGVAFYQGDDVSLFREPLAAGGSPLVDFLESRGPATALAVSHIRRATRGTIRLANTQPFARELGGRMHVFAHNGDLPDIYRSDTLAVGQYRPIGQSDSEHAFCALLERLRSIWVGSSPPPLKTRHSVLKAFARDLRPLGPANFLYADGDALFAHGDRRVQRGTGRIEPPGLWWLQRECSANDLASDHAANVSVDTTAQVLLLASVPLSNERWQPISVGKLLVARAGQLVLC